MNNKTMMYVSATVSMILIITVITIAYQALVVVPRERIEAQERENQAQRLQEEIIRKDREYKLEECRQVAHDAYSKNWDSKCVLDGKEKDCSLPAFVADKFDEDLGEAKDRCITLYK